VILEPGQRVRIPHRADLPGHVKIEMANPIGDGWTLFVEQAPGTFAKVELTAAQAAACEVLTEDGAGDSAALLAGLWTAWMRAAGSGARSAVLASTPLRPYAHQLNVVYGAMLPQPRLRFLLADEPGTGKTIMAGLYLREMQPCTQPVSATPSMMILEVVRRGEDRKAGVAVGQAAAGVGQVEGWGLDQ